jgi:hypothetical protein
MKKNQSIKKSFKQKENFKNQMSKMNEEISLEIIKNYSKTIVNEEYDNINETQIFLLGAEYLKQAGICKKLNKIEKSYFFLLKYF